MKFNLITVLVLILIAAVGGAWYAEKEGVIDVLPDYGKPKAAAEETTPTNFSRIPRSPRGRDLFG